MVTILHLSDLHIRLESVRDQQELLEALWRDLKRQKADRTIDLVVFTGDLTFSADHREFREARTRFMDPLMDLLAISPQHFILVHGNHDNDIARVEEFAEAGLYSGLNSREAVNSLLDKQGQLDLHTERLSAWRAFHESFYGTAQSLHRGLLSNVHRLMFGDISVAIAAFDSAWRATGRPNDYDNGHLIVGDRQLQSVEPFIAEAELKIAAMHHPLDWLTAFDREDVSRHLERHFDILLTGHTHVSDPQQLVRPGGHYIHCASGSLYADRVYSNSYTILDIDVAARTARISLRTFQPGRHEFDAGVDVAPNGIVTFALPEKSRGNGSSVVSSHAVSSAAQMLTAVRASNVLTPVLPEHIVSDIGDVLVTPVLLPVPYHQYLLTQDPKTARRHKQVDALAALKEHNVLIVAGDEHAGLTSTLYWILLKQFDVSNNTMPVLISSATIGPGISPIEKAVRRALLDDDIALAPAEPLPRLSLAIDDVHALPLRRVERLAAFVADQPDNLYVFGCRSSEERFLMRALAERGIAFKVVHLGPFGRRQIRELLHILQVEDSSGNALDRISRLVSREGLPRDPFMIAALASVVTAKDFDLPGANETIVLAAYTDLLLGRGDLFEDSRNAMDFRDREHLIAYLAERMLDTPSQEMSRVDLETLVASYFRSLGWTEPVTDVLNSLIRRRILCEGPGNLVRFANAGILALFAAKRTLDDDMFLGRVLAEPMRYRSVIRHRSALRRNDRELLARVSELLSSDDSMPGGIGLFDRMTDSSGWSYDVNGVAVGVHLDLSEDNLADQPETDHDVDAAAAGSDDTEDIQDEMWDSISDIQQRWGMRESLNPDDMLPPIRTMESVILTSALLRNSELVADAELKESLLRVLLARWADLSALISTDEVFQAMMAGFISAMEDQSEPDGRLRARKSDELHSEFALIFPIIISYSEMGQWLASRKLAELLRRILKDKKFTDHPGQALMATLLSQHIRIPGWADDILSLVHRHGERRVIFEVVHWVGTSTYFSESITPAEQSAIEQAFVELDKKRVAGAEDANRKMKRNQMLQALRRVRQARLARQSLTKAATPLDVEDFLG